MTYMRDKKGRRLDSFEAIGADESRRAGGIWGGSPVANEAMWADGAWTNVYASNTRKRYITNRATGFVRLVYAAVAGLGDTINTQPFVLRASIESPAGTFKRVLFKGSREAVPSPGGIIISDPVYVNFTAGQQFYVRTHAAGPNIFTFSQIMGTQIAWGESCDGSTDASSADKTLAGTMTPNAVSHVSPVAIIGDAGMGLAFVCLVGDSIMAGLGDYDNIVDFGRGFGRRAMGNVIPYVNIALSGDSLTTAKPFRYLLTQGCTDVLSNMGTNDVKNGSTLAIIQASMIASWIALGAFGARVWQTTITPQTTSTDAWATTANQTVTAHEAVRVGLNDWLRDGAPMSGGVAVAVGAAGTRANTTGHPLTGYFDAADAVETSRNSGIWRVGSVYTGDGMGLHPNSAGAALVAAAIDTTKFVS